MAVDDFTAAIKLNDELAIAYLGRGQANAYRHDYKAARADWEKVVALAPNNSPLATAARGYLQKLTSLGH